MYPMLGIHLFIGNSDDLCHPCTNPQNTNPQKMKGFKMEKFFYLCSNGEIHFYGCFKIKCWELKTLIHEEAEKKQLDVAYIFSETTAKSWIDTLQKHLSQ